MGLSRNGALEVYSRNLGFDRNIVRNLGKHNILDGVRDLTARREAGFAKIGIWKGNGVRDS